MTRMQKCIRLFRDISSGLIVGIVAISFYIPCAPLLFQGQLATHMSTAIGIALAGGAILALISAFKNSIVMSSVGPEPVTVPILAGMTGAIAAQCSVSTALPTAVVGLSIAALVIGLVWYMLGRYGAGNIIRYIPYPVIGGFLAAVGWLMLTGGIGVVAGKSFTLTYGLSLFTYWPGYQLAAGFLVALTIWWATNAIKHMLLMPILIVSFSILIHLFLHSQGIDTETAREYGWLMREFSLALPVFPLQPSVLAQVDWGVLTREAGVILSATIVTTIGLLLSGSSLEVAFDERADLNRELKVLGIGNMILAGFGGLAGGISISRSLLNRKTGALTRLSGIVKAAVCLLAMVVGGPLITLIPKAVFGGILMYMGLSMLKTWLFDGRHRLSRNDYLIVITILVLNIFIGSLPAVVVGIVICCFDFAISSARLGPVRREVSRNEWPRSFDRNASQEGALQLAGEKLRIVELQGALFFGSIQTLSEHLELVMETSKQGLEELVIDFTRVSAVDSSAAQALAKFLKVAARHRVNIAFSALSNEVRAVLQANGCLPENGPSIHANIDAAILEWENTRLGSPVAHPTEPLADWLASELGSPKAAQKLMDRMERITLAPGAVLFQQGEDADALYLVEYGQLTSTIAGLGHGVRVRTVLAGGTLGELGLYRERPRSTSVRAEVATQVLRLSKSAIAEMERNAPELAMQVHKLFVRSLSTRLQHANAQAAALST